MICLYLSRPHSQTYFFLSDNSTQTGQLMVVLRSTIIPSKLRISILTLAGVYLRGLGKEEMEILWQFQRTSARSFVTEVWKNIYWTFRRRFLKVYSTKFRTSFWWSQKNLHNWCKQVQQNWKILLGNVVELMAVASAFSFMFYHNRSIGDISL